MASTSRVVEFTVLSGEDLNVSRKQRVKKNAFVIVRTDTCNAQRTKMDKDGGSYPSWNEKLVVDLPMHARYVVLEVYCKTNLGDKLVGTANIPTSDFLGGYVPHGHLHFLSYRLRDSYGERNGIINLSVRVTTTENGEFMASCSRPPWPGVPVGGDDVRSGVVTGVPVGYKY